jgi:hypothetical protein
MESAKQLLERLILLSCTALIPGCAQADVMTFLSGPPDYEFISGTENTLSFSEMSVGTYNTFWSSNSNYPQVQGSDSAIAIQTGPLGSSTATSWTFDGGTFHRDDGLGVDYISSPPPGYATCEEAGFITFGDQCRLNAVLNGTILGDVTLSLSQIVGYGSIGSDEPFTIRQFELTGSLLFSISPSLALATGVTAGPYLGWFAVDGTYFHSITGDPGFLYDFTLPDEWHSIDVRSLEVTGESVPEPMSIFLLATVLIRVGSAIKRKFSARVC